jgi:hypothetical protein
VVCGEGQNSPRVCFLLILTDVRAQTPPNTSFEPTRRAPFILLSLAWYLALEWSDIARTRRAAQFEAVGRLSPGQAKEI